MSFKTALAVIPVSSSLAGLEGEQLALAVLSQNLSICPKKINGVKISDDVKSLYAEWLETLQEHLDGAGLTMAVIPNWGRDLPKIQRAYAMCRGDKESVRKLMCMFWQDDRYTKYDPSLHLFDSCLEDMVLRIARAKRETED